MYQVTSPDTLYLKFGLASEPFRNLGLKYRDVCRNFGDRPVPFRAFLCVTITPGDGSYIRGGCPEYSRPIGWVLDEVLTSPASKTFAQSLCVGGKPPSCCWATANGFSLSLLGGGLSLYPKP